MVVPEGQPFLRWFARRPSGEVLGGHVESPSGLERIAANMDRKGYNTYIGLNHTHQWRGLRIKGSDIDRIGAIVLDLDAHSNWVDPVDAGLAAAESAESLLGRRIYPAIIDTGRGAQVWIVFHEARNLSTGHRKCWEAGVSFLLRYTRDALGTVFGCRLDTTVGDLARVVRCPGTINTKTGRTARVVQWGEPIGFADWEQHPIWVAAAAQQQERERRSLLCRDNVADHPVTLDKIWGSLKVTARRFLSNGVHEPGRHSAAFATAASLGEAGLNEHDALHFTLLAAKKCTPQLSDFDTRRCVANAYLRL